MVQYCCCFGCNEKYVKGGDVTFHSFPKDDVRKKIWVQKLRRENFTPTKFSKVCSKHFEEKCFDREKFGGVWLKADAVPTIFNFPKHLVNQSTRSKSPVKRTSEASEVLLSAGQRSPMHLLQLPENRSNSGTETCTGQTQQSPEELPRNGDPPKKNRRLKVPALVEGSEGNDSRQYADEFEDEPAEVRSFPGYIADTSIIDHDYLGYNLYRAPQTPEHPAVKDSSQLVLDDVKKELCRLCGQKGSQLTSLFEPLFSDTSQDLSLNAKIEMYLPFKVKMNDPLPPQVCSKCHDVLNQWHELYVTCVAANAVLWKTFGRGCDKSQNCADSSIPRVQERSETHLPAEAQEKEHDVLCPELSGIKTAEQQEQKREDKLELEDEIDKCLANVQASLFTCCFCFEAFKTSLQRKEHVAMCRQLSTICELCGHLISCRKDLRRHRYQKHSETNNLRKYLCTMCDKRFRTPCILNHHVNIIHRVDDAPKYHCEHCCRTFVSKNHHRSHMKQHDKGEIQSIFKIEALTNDQNPDTPSVFACPVCHEMFTDTFSLVIHLTKKRKIKCSECRKVSSSEKRFMLHQCGLWTCQFCAKSFDKKIKLIVHERIHTGEKPLKCRVCDKTFRTWQSRRHHETSHQPLFECHYCGKNFRNKYVFEDHVQFHEGKDFSCSVCAKTFSGRKNLRKHICKYHKN